MLDACALATLSAASPDDLRATSLAAVATSTKVIDAVGDAGTTARPGRRFLLCGRHTTKVYTPAAAQGPELYDRQWFTIGGPVPLSAATGQECPGGSSRAESKLGGIDILINIGLAVAGGIAGGVRCSNESGADRNACTSLGAAVVPFFIGSRTVEYTCAGPGAAADAPVRSRLAQSAADEQRELGQPEDEAPQVGLGDVEVRPAEVH